MHDEFSTCFNTDMNEIYQQSNQTMFNITELTCRVCLQEQQVLINVFEELEDLQTTLCSLLETCGDLQVDSDDAFPKYLCEECTGELLIAAKFREKCSKSKETLRSVQKVNEIEDGSGDVFNEIIEYSSDVGAITECEVNETKTSDSDYPKDGMLQPSGTCVQGITEYYNNEENACDAESFTLENDYVEDTTVTLAESSAVDEEIKPIYNIDYVPVANEICAYEVRIGDPDTELIKAIPSKGQKKSYKCDICGAVFVQAINLQKHLQKNHATVQCYTCRVCNHWFTLEIELIKHENGCKESLDDGDKKKRKSNTNEPVESHRKCVYCDRDFQTPFALRMHLRTHTGERPYPCTHCDKAFKTQSSLSVHIKRHTGQADFVCTECGKSFYEQGNLDVHMRSHTGERPHVCTVCQKTFTRVFLLELHMRIHTGEKPFSCSYCDRSFRQRTDWKSHLSTHTGIKQYNCRLCMKGFVKRASLLHHIQSHHALQIGVDGQDTDPNKIEMFNALDYIIETGDSG